MKYAVNNNIRNKFVNENRLRQTYNHYSGNQNNTFVNPIVSQRNSTSSIINRINLSALPSVFQQQSRFRTNRARFYRSVQDDNIICVIPLLTLLLCVSTHIYKSRMMLFSVPWNILYNQELQIFTSFLRKPFS